MRVLKALNILYCCCCRLCHSFLSLAKVHQNSREARLAAWNAELS